MANRDDRRRCGDTHRLAGSASAAHLEQPFEPTKIVNVVSEHEGWSAQEYELFHYRDRDGVEVDIVAEFTDGSILAFEVKSSASFNSSQFSGLRALRDRLGSRFLGGFVLNTGASGYSFGQKLWGMPIAALWQA